MALLIWALAFLWFKIFAAETMVRGLTPIKEPFNTCECDILGKQHCEIFPKGVSYREKKPLELVQIDLCAPMAT